MILALFNAKISGFSHFQSIFGVFPPFYYVPQVFYYIFCFCVTFHTPVFLKTIFALKIYIYSQIRQDISKNTPHSLLDIMAIFTVVKDPQVTKKYRQQQQSSVLS